MFPTFVSAALLYSARSRGGLFSRADDSFLSCFFVSPIGTRFARNTSPFDTHHHKLKIHFKKSIRFLPFQLVAPVSIIVVSIRRR